MKPVWTLTAGAATLTPETAGTAYTGFAVSTDMGMGCWAGGFTIRLSPDHGLPLAAGAEAALELGLDGQLTPVARGQITAIRRRLDAVEADVLCAAAGLLAIRPVRTYRGQKAGVIIRDLCAAAKVAPGLVEPGIDLPFYALDGSRSALHHIHELAVASGCDAYISPLDQLQAVRWTAGPATVTCTYGEDLLSLVVEQAPPAPAGVAVAGEGAAAKQGAARWHWLPREQEPALGRVGADGDEARWLSNAALRSPDAAGSLARSVVAMARRRATAGTVRVAGAPGAAPGGTLAIVGTPGGAHDGIYQIRRVRHHLSAQAGFVTDIDFIGKG